MLRQAQHGGLSKDELIDGSTGSPCGVLKLQRPAKTSRTSSKPPSTDRKERREQSRPGGAKPGHEGHNRVAAEVPDMVVDHRPSACPDCGLALSLDLVAETVSVHERIELPEVKPVVEQHRRLAVVCPGCRARVAAPRPTGAASTPREPVEGRPAPPRHGEGSVEPQLEPQGQGVVAGVERVGDIARQVSQAGLLPVDMALVG